MAKRKRNKFTWFMNITTAAKWFFLCVSPLLTTFLLMAFVSLSSILTHRTKWMRMYINDQWEKMCWLQAFHSLIRFFFSCRANMSLLMGEWGKCSGGFYTYTQKIIKMYICELYFTSRGTLSSNVKGMKLGRLRNDQRVIGEWNLLASSDDS